MIPLPSRALVRSGAFHALLADVWTEAAPGIGCVRPAARDVLPDLVTWLTDTGAMDRQRPAFLLGLLADAAQGDARDEIRQRIHDALPLAVEALEDHARRPAETGDVMRGALLYLLAQFPDRAADLMPGVAAALGPDAPGTGALHAVYTLAASHPERSHFIRQFLGAEACAGAGAHQLAMAEATLACPLCHGALRFADEGITCIGCAQTYGWAGESPDLVPPGCADADHYPAELVDLYESKSRPRFVQVMANDWHAHVPAERERDYITAHLHPVAGAVLDLACGAGGWTRHVAAHVGRDRVIALDYSPAMLNACRAALPGVLTVRGSASALPIRAGGLGGANCSDALQALPDPARALLEVGRCLAPGAPFTAFTFAEAAFPYRYFQHRFPVVPRRLFTRESLTAYLEAAELDTVNLGGPQQALFTTARRRG